MRIHGEQAPRGSQRATLSPLYEGRFGRMFRRLPALTGPENPVELRALLEPLASAMVEPEAAGGWSGSPQNFDNPRIPAGWTYFGQFVDHDITFDPMSSLDRTNDPDALHDFRTPRYDLDSVYGSGPRDEPFQYDKDDPEKLLIGRTTGGEPDLPRNDQGIALIGDPRNDENFIDQVRADPSVPAERKFDEAQRLTRWTYQWLVVNEYLPLIIGEDLFDDIYKVNKGVPDITLHYYKARTRPYMPVEFSAASFRFGHSMIRGIYNLNDVVRDKPIFVAGDEVPKGTDLRGRAPLLDSWQIDWKQFFAISGSNPQPSRLIDAKLVPALNDLPGPGDPLALRNLMRGYALQLPSGQDVARLLKVPKVFTGAELGTTLDPTPLWFYLLKESELAKANGDGQLNGQHLGPTGGRIIAEVLLGLLEGDKQGYINQQPAWAPPVPDADGDGVTIADVISFVTS
jgi:hypothetical protein